MGASVVLRRLGGGWNKNKDFDQYGIRVRTRLVRSPTGAVHHDVHLRNYKLFDAEVLTHFRIPSITPANYTAAPFDQAYESLRPQEWIRLWNLGDGEDRQCQAEGSQPITDPKNDIEIIEGIHLAEHPGFEPESKSLVGSTKDRIDGP